MEAILLLAHKGVDYIDKFCEQFNNDKRYNIYIHYDTKLHLTEHDKLILQTKYGNIKSIISKYSGTYFGMSLVDAELELLNIAMSDKDNTYFHLMSEQCYLLVSLNTFCAFFKHNSNVFMDFQYDKEGWQIIDKDKGLRWAGSQWWSLPRRAVDWLQQIISTTDYDSVFREALLKYNAGREIRIIAADETYFTNLFKLYDNDFIYYDNMRFYDFTWPLIDFCHPHPLTILKLRKYINDGIIGKLIGRKIDYKNLECTKLLQQIQYINRYAGDFTSIT